MRRELRIEYREFVLKPSTTIQLTDCRVAVTESATTRYIPLEQIRYVLHGQFSSPGWLYATIILAILSLIGIPLVGATSLLLLLPAAICFGVYLLKRWECLYIDSGAAIPLYVELSWRVSRYEDADGNQISGTPVDQLIEELEIARQQCVDR